MEKVMENGAHISVKNLNVYYRKNMALSDISIDIPGKKITAIIGPSGCGKTTLLKSFNRLVDAYDGVRVTGSVLVDGEDIFDSRKDVTEIRKKMGLLSQRPCPLPMSIFENVAFGPRLVGNHDRKALAVIVEHHLREASLWEEVKDRLWEPAKSLSIGQQQRLCLARGLAVEPEIILGDEPTSALDPSSSTRIEEKFRQLKNHYTIVFVTHILRQAKRLADFVIFLYCGKIVEAGPADVIFNDPKEPLTREYITGVIS